MLGEKIRDDDAYNFFANSYIGMHMKHYLLENEVPLIT